MIPHPFDYHAPKSLPETIALLKQFGDSAKLLAGGHSLLPMMKIRFAAPEHLIDLAKVDELKGIRKVDSELHIGAMTTENELIWSPLVEEHCPLLVEAARLIADPQVRYKGTIGGDVSHGDPGNDHPAIMLALGASFVLHGSAGDRVVHADDFFIGLYTTALQADEVLREIRLPIPEVGTGWCYAKLKRKTGDFATAAAAVLLRMNGEKVDEVSIALTNVSDVALKAGDAEAALRGKVLSDATIAEAGRLAMAICAPVEDQRGDVEYKTAMAGEMTQRALRTARSRAVT